MSGLQSLFDPDRVAVIGATDRDGSVGRAIMENLDRTFDGGIVPINPNREEVLGYPCVPSVDEAAPIDLAVIVLPGELVLDVMENLGAASVQHVIVISAGFGESDSEGSERERRLIDIAAQYDMEVIGPNSLGVMSTASGLNASFGPQHPSPGPISLLSQSGAFVTAILDWATDTDLGFHHVVSLGNEAVIDETDILAAWSDDPGTKAVMGYLEGIDDGRAFIDTVREVTRDTPVVVVKSGRTAAGSRAASSHTGSLAGDDAAYEAGLKQAGVIRVTSVTELLDATRALAHLPMMETEGVAVVTNAGGPGVMATDAVGTSRIRLAEFSDETIASFSSLLPRDASIYNPVDILGDAEADRFVDAVEIAREDDNVGAVLIVVAPTGVLSFESMADQLRDVASDVEIPIVMCAMGGTRSREAMQGLEAEGIPVFYDPDRAVFGLDVLSRQRSIRERTIGTPRTFDVNQSVVEDMIAGAVERDQTQLGLEGLSMLRAYGIETPPGEVATGLSEAEEIAERIGDPMAMKLVSPDITHKSDIGGVALDVSTGEVGSAYERIITNAQNYQADARIVGVYIQEMLDLGESTETIVGATRDPQFGPMLLFGLGGVFVETLEDTTVRIAPITEDDARMMVEDIKAAPLLRGARGRPPADLDAIVDALERLSQLMLDHPRILELDVNPLIASSDGALAIDFRATIDTEEA